MKLSYKFTLVRKKLSKAKKKGKKAGIKRWKQILKAGNTFCSENTGSEPTPTPTPTPVPSAFLHWDAEGKLTEAGKDCFDIPQELEANVLTGETIEATNCNGCHSDKLSRKFDQYRTLIAADPMFIVEEDVSDEKLAHITAYLNRFNPNECP